MQVDGRDDRNPVLEKLFNFLPSLGVPAARRIAVCETIDQDDLGMPAEDAFNINDVFSCNLQSGSDFVFQKKLVDFRRRFGLNRSDDNIFPALLASQPFAKHLRGFADARCVSQEDL